MPQTFGFNSKPPSEKTLSEVVDETGDHYEEIYEDASFNTAHLLKKYGQTLRDTGIDPTPSVLLTYAVALRTGYEAAEGAALDAAAVVFKLGDAS